ncbi:hypothetical protein HK101_003618 [Irineochytrium annulatum]|nr:hypothetical protein HK101_003618 [Irineochytrium annulatum]
MNLLTIFAAVLAASAVEAAPSRRDNTGTVIPITKRTKGPHTNKRVAVNRWAARLALPGQHRRQVTAPNVDEGDEYYICPVTLGNGQSFQLDLDTGSSDTWFRGSACKSSDGSCGTPGQRQVNTDDSMLKPQGKTWSTSYGSGSVSGQIYTAPIAIGVSPRQLVVLF